METAAGNFQPLAASSKSFAQRLLTIGETRLELLALEVQEERERLLCTPSCWPSAWRPSACWLAFRRPDRDHPGI